MQGHLTDAQLTDALDGASQVETRGHLESCHLCRKEQERLRNAIFGCRERARALAQQPEGFWQWQMTWIRARLNRPSHAPRRSWRWAWGGAMVTFLVFALALMIERPTRHSQVTEEDPDQALLVEVQLSAQRDLPEALQPAALLAQEVNQAAEAKSTRARNSIN